MRKPVQSTNEHTRRQALRLAARALAVAERVLQQEHDSQPERRGPEPARAAVALLRRTA